MGYTTLAMADLTIWDVLLRLFAAALCGGVIGIDRGRKRRAAGFRTYMLVCMGAALTMVLSTYLSVMIADIWKLDVNTFKTDVSRFGAQVINGIGNTMIQHQLLAISIPNLICHLFFRFLEKRIRITFVIVFLNCRITQSHMDNRHP